MMVEIYDWVLFIDVLLIYLIGFIMGLVYGHNYELKTKGGDGG